MRDDKEIMTLKMQLIFEADRRHSQLLRERERLEARGGMAVCLILAALLSVLICWYRFG